ncbi:DNA-binding transcriptional LysR family regulator [Lachnospiraceae bacterium PM6-15]|uniref:LysR family transcriptional regulator n=1 Tax=Ohessyouella blattaphilus TaxID=2949333 RepID=UPI003E192059
MTTERLQEFLTLASVLNYSRAADILFISQSILSRHISELERELDKQLFIRNTHSVKLTPEGRYYQREIEMFMKKVRLVESKLSSTTPASDRRVHIRCEEQTLCTQVLNHIAEFKKLYPDIRLQFDIIHSVSDISATEDVDLLFCSYDFTNSLPEGLHFHHLLSQSAVMAIPPYHHLGDLQEIHLENLCDDILIVPRADEIFGSYTRNATLASHKSKGIIRRIIAQTLEEALLMVELGEGIMIMPHHFKRRVYPHTLTLNICDSDCVFPIYAYAHQETENEAAQIFMAELSS